MRDLGGLDVKARTITEICQQFLKVWKLSITFLMCLGGLRGPDLVCIIQIE